MTYCVGIKLKAGMIFASDSRTNAGIDQIAQFRKTYIFSDPGERVIYLLSAGNLSVTQSVINQIERSRLHADEQTPSLWNATSLFDVATLLGDYLREVQNRDGPFLAQAGIDAGASFVVGGQIRGERARMFHLYPQGNFIEATEETLYFQLGESKYGRPILDRVINSATSLKEATKCVLVSYDSTMRSNVSVGPPIEICWYSEDSLQLGLRQRVQEEDPYFQLIRSEWAVGVRRAFMEVPDPDWFYQHV
ncbi:MAG: peptidase [Lysobacterales bacterium]